MTTTLLEPGREELANRASDGLEVSLLWSRRTNRVSVAVVDTRTGERFELTISDGENALDVFHHPYAYAASRGIEYAVPERVAS
ncbi:MAG: hypothetical protein M3312_03635 [Actinomycetota bacterium]|nr:hypothetical protein [Actinomycetota bacterium]